MTIKTSRFERVKRSVAKSIAFRILVLLSDFVVILFFTHRLDVTLGVIILSNTSSTVIYYLHERIWSRIGWGRTHPQA